MASQNMMLQVDGLAKPIGIFVHLFYDELADETFSLLENIVVPFDLYISTDDETKARRISASLYKYAFGEHATVRVMQNRGRDAATFLVGFKDEIKEYEFGLRLHGKKSTHNNDDFGFSWRRYLYEELAGNRERGSFVLRNFMKHPELGIQAAQHWAPIKSWATIGENFEAMRGLLARQGLEISPNEQIDFPSGGMFWFRNSALLPLLNIDLSWDDFPPDDGGIRDASLAHAVERSYFFFAAAAGLGWAYLPRFELGAGLSLDEQTALVEQSGEFDRNFYLRNYPDVAAAGTDPLRHYLEFGFLEGRKPSVDFDTAYYRAQIRRSGTVKTNPLVHFLLEGRCRGLSKSRPLKQPATTRVDDLYAAYKRSDQSSEYVPESFPQNPTTAIKPIAFYLPQFHPFEENDRFWGKGFTEWTNTSKAPALFAGHYQPRLPGELGFYDTRLKETLKRQVELAKQYGIYGFCFHHYFFEGRPLMRAPYNHYLANKDLDLPFCLHWANEPWTASWDGQAEKSRVLLAQRHSAEDDIAFFRDIEPALRDERYIRINGRPLLLIYRPHLFPDMSATIGRWRDSCREAGVGDPFLAVMQTTFEGRVNPEIYGFDAAIEYPPHTYSIDEVSYQVQLYDDGFEGYIHNFAELKDKALAREEEAYPLFRGIIPGWDCTARRANPMLFLNCEPHFYRRWFERLCSLVERRLPENQRFIFINAWNEWAEGAYLEPDRKYGYAFLDATARALAQHEISKKPAIFNRIGIGAHIHYLDLLDEFIEYFSNVPGPFDLLVTVTDRRIEKIKTILEKELAGHASSVMVRRVENVGRDMGPFVLEFLPWVKDYDVCCWVHSKKSVYEPAYANWRKYLLTYLLGSPSDVVQILEKFASDGKLGVLYPPVFPAVSDKVEWGSNFSTAQSLLSRIGVQIDEGGNPVFPVGGMFWFRPKALDPLGKLKIGWNDFRNSDAQKNHEGVVVDGSLSHAFERMILYVSNSAGFHSRQLTDLEP
jgi:lipopolysaccharide biosynthesis protein